MKRLISISTSSSSLNILRGSAGASQARGATVIIDVCRAFTTACVLFGNGLKTLYVVSKVDDAFRLRRDHFPDALLIGEVDGIKVDGFDWGNSPHLVSSQRFDGKTAILRTSSGTVGLELARQAGAGPILAASFVNAGATADYLRSLGTRGGTIVPMGWKGKTGSVEDDQCADYIQALVEGRLMEEAAIKTLFDGHPDLKRFQAPEEVEFLIQDLDICFDFNRYEFALKAEMIDRTANRHPLPSPLMQLVPVPL